MRGFWPGGRFDRAGPAGLFDRVARSGCGAGSLRGFFDQRTAGRWSGQMSGGKRAGGRRRWVRDGRGRAGGFTSNALRRTPLANPSSAQELFVRSTKALPLARICYRSRGSFGLRACSPPCPNSPGLTSRAASPSPLPRRSRFVFFPPARGGWAAQRQTTLASQQHNQRSATLARKRGCHLAGKTPAEEKWARSGQEKPPRRTHPRLSRCARKPGGPGCGPLASQKKLPRGAQAGLAEAVRKRSRTGGERKNEREIV